MKRSSNGLEGGGGGGGGGSSSSSPSGGGLGGGISSGSPGGSCSVGGGGVNNNSNSNGFIASDWWKRDFCYATLTLITFPLPLVFRSVNSKKMVAYGHLADHIVEQNEIPLPNILYVVGMECLKVVLASLLYPGGANGGSGGGGMVGSSSMEGRVSSKLPVSRRDREASGTRTGGVYTKSLEIWKSLWNFLACCLVCHISMILFGAPLLENFSLTLEFSVILVSLSVFPLYLSMKAGSILVEIAYISVWNTQQNSVFLAKWRLLLTIFGCMVGAIFIPLDWDRPWQKWPITCLVSSMITFYSINVILFLYIFCSVYCKSFKSMIFNRNSNKIKYF